MPSYSTPDFAISWLPGTTSASVIIGATLGTSDTPSGAHAAAAVGIGRSIELVQLNVTTAGGAGAVATISGLDTSNTTTTYLTYPLAVGVWNCGGFIVPGHNGTNKQTLQLALPATAVANLVYRIIG